MRAKVVVSWNFSVDDIKGNDGWVSFYTGFQFYVVFLVFFQFSLPVAENMNFYHSENAQVRRIRKIDRQNGNIGIARLAISDTARLYLALREEDLDFCYGLSVSTVSRLMTT